MLNPSSRTSYKSTESPTSQRTSTTSDYRPSKTTSRKSRSSTELILPPMESTNSLTGPQRRSKPFSDSPWTEMTLTSRCGLLQLDTRPPVTSTGTDLERKLQLRTKNLVDHAGHSVPTRLSNPDMPSLTDNSSTSPNRNSLTVLDLSETTDALVDGCTGLMTTLRLREDLL